MLVYFNILYFNLILLSTATNISLVLLKNDFPYSIDICAHYTEQDMFI